MTTTRRSSTRNQVYLVKLEGAKHYFVNRRMTAIVPMEEQ